MAGPARPQERLPPARVSALKHVCPALYSSATLAPSAMYVRARPDIEQAHEQVNREAGSAFCVKLFSLCVTFVHRGKILTV